MKNKHTLIQNQKCGKWTVINPVTQIGRIECQCECGNTVKVRRSDLTSGKSKSCLKCCNKQGPFDKKQDLTGKTINDWYVVKPVHMKTTWKWLCKCSCGQEKVVSHNDLIQNKSRRCHKKIGNESGNYKGCESISGTLINRIKKGAKARNLECNVTAEELYQLAEKQNFCCALTGEKLIFPYNKKFLRSKHNASLDRMDSHKGYTIDNVQWITIDANLAKQQLTQSEFINLCMKVSMNYLQESQATENQDYKTIALRTQDDTTVQLLHACMGLSTEVGELTDALKKYIFYGSKLNGVNAVEELGDIMWYLALACRALNTDFETVCATNINKLKTRYPEKFTEYLATNRDLNAEAVVLSEGVMNNEI
jgi:NTP pyrophosphatase (non-canonical NTP hydrolase)